MHHLTVDEWSRRQSYLHARDPRAKIIGLLFFLVVLATTPLTSPASVFLARMGAYGALLLTSIALARLPAGALEIRAMAVLPFSLTFGLVSWLAGEPGRAMGLVVKSYLSALGVLIVVSTTPIPLLLRGLELLGAPRVFILVVQFLHRYLFIISEQARRMLVSAACRRGERKGGAKVGFRAGAGAISVLFGRSYARAQGIHLAMLSRGFSGKFAAVSGPRAGWADVLFLALAVLCTLSVRLAFPHG